MIFTGFVVDFYVLWQISVLVGKLFCILAWNADEYRYCCNLRSDMVKLNWLICLVKEKQELYLNPLALSSSDLSTYVKEKQELYLNSLIVKYPLSLTSC